MAISLYGGIWILFITIWQKNKLANNLYTRSAVVTYFTLAAILLGGFHSAYHLSDTLAYMRAFEGLLTKPFANALDQWEPGFATLTWAVGRLTANARVYLMVVAAVFMLAFLVGLKKIVPPRSLPYALLAYMNYPFFFSYLTNGLRQGIAIAFLLLSVGFLVQRRDVGAVVSAILATLFHSTGFIAFVPLLVKYLVLPTSIYIYGWLSLVVVAFMGIGVSLTEQVADWVGLGEKFDIYSNVSLFAYYNSGFRWDFILLSAFPIAYTIIWKRIFGKNDVLDFLLRCYIALNSVYVLFYSISFADRVAAYSWLMIPLMLYYPISTLQNVALRQRLHLFFVLVTIFIGIASVPHERISITGIDWFF